MHSIAILTCYFGPWPWYFPYFIHSCRYNPTIDFLIVTDNKYTPISLPKNLRIIEANLLALREQFSERLKIEVKVETPYKLCDLKPAYGYLFNDLLKEYSWWGHGDIDVIYGDIRGFITDNLLSSYDLICGRHDFISGVFTLFQNSLKMNTLFKLSKDFPKVFESSIHYCFDECNFLWKPIGELADPKDIYKIPYEIDSMTHVIRRLEKENVIKPYFEFMMIEGIPGAINWTKGKLYYKNEFEALLYHLIKFKKVNKPSLSFESMPNSFSISTTRIFNHKWD
jgi:hypothetical protein